MNEGKLKQIKENIADYEQVEFEVEYDPNNIFKNSLVQPIAFTTLDENEEIQIQVNLDLERLLLITEVKPTSPKKQYMAHYEYETFDSLDEIVALTENMNFNELIRLNADEEDLEKIFKIENIIL
ncbi:hypothetical protein BU104_14365 [Staphylococcus xylosus]|uniref:Uncharacterized protein n=1 Tax=Staphylococcus xylosus TaxID=1288 RepID=A0AAQ0LWG2_STAXY|nr:hypothetical protein [Staphylococcus xylosus]RIM90455.1 hypothetical protein BU104_14365 [Staphylococcus xylosus]